MYRFINKFNYLKSLLITVCWRKIFFKNIGRKSVIYTPLRIFNPQNINIGSSCVIEKNSTLYSVGKYNDKIHNGKISIGNNVYINYGFNATSACSIEIEDDVLVAFNVSIFDFNHDYLDISKNVNKTDLMVKGPVVIGEKSWIGMNVSIIGDVKIGKHCIIGANSVITKDIPDYCMVSGNPAVIIKKYNLQTKEWKKVV